MMTSKVLGLHDNQWPVFDDPARFPVVAAGRRFGKTELSLVKLFTGGKDGRGCLTRPGLYRYVAPTQKLARKVLWRRKLKRALHPSWLSKPPNETNLEVTFKNGSILEVLGAEEEGGLRGEGVTGVVLDEYAQMRLTSFPEEVRPSLADEKGWAMFIGTPQSFNHFYDMFNRGQDARHPTWKSWQFRSIDNPLIDPEEIEEARRTTDPRTFRQEWEASFEAIAGRIYYAFTRAEHVRKVALEKALPVCLTFDFNYNPATAVIGQRLKDECRIVHEVFLPFRGGEATIASANACKDWLAEQGFKSQIRIYGDSTGKSMKTTGPSDHQVLRDMFPYASWCIPNAQPNPRDRHAAVNGRCRTADGRSHLTIDPSCEKLIADLERVIYAPNGEEDQKTDPNLTHISAAFGYWAVQDWPPVKKGGAAEGSAHWL